MALNDTECEVCNDALLPQLGPSSVLAKDFVPAPQLSSPEYINNISEWNRWRTVYNGGREFLDSYLQMLPNEEQNRYDRRKDVTPTSTFASAAITEVKDSVFQRMVDITRRGGTDSYQAAVRGDKGGVDLRSMTMNQFIGTRVLEELLVMRRVGIYVDNTPRQAQLASEDRGHPYCYIYKSEDILNYNYHPETGELMLVVVRARVPIIDPMFRLPIGQETEFRVFYMNTKGTVTVRRYGANEKLKSSSELRLPSIPMHIAEISTSLMKNVCGHQIALMNLESLDMAFLMGSNTSIYTEQVDTTTTLAHLRPRDGESAAEKDTIEVGTGVGRRYGKGLERPDYISPPTDPVEVSMKKQETLKDDIRRLINLAASTVKPVRASAESKTLDSQGLESGLSNIGLVLEAAESAVARMWGMYENVPPEELGIRVAYPRRYSLRSEEQRQKEADSYLSLRDKVPSRRFQKALTKHVVEVLVGDRIPQEELDNIYAEIELAKGITSDGEQLRADTEAGLVSKATASELRQYPESEVKIADEEHKQRLERIAAAQSEGGIQNAASRGLPDADPDPDSGAKEKQGKRRRGRGRNPAAS